MLKANTWKIISRGGRSRGTRRDRRSRRSGTRISGLYSTQQGRAIRAPQAHGRLYTEAGGRGRGSCGWLSWRRGLVDNTPEKFPHGIKTGVDEGNNAPLDGDNA